VTTEVGGTATFTVALRPCRPRSHIGLSSSDLTEGRSRPLAHLHGADALDPKTVTVTGVDDTTWTDRWLTRSSRARGEQRFGYSGRDAADVSVTNNDNESADPIFKDGFESGNVRPGLQPNVGGRLAVTASAASTARSALRNVTDTNALYVQDDTPAAEPATGRDSCSTRRLPAGRERQLDG